MTRTRSLQKSLIIAMVAFLLAFGVTQSWGTNRGMPPAATHNDANAAEVANCMTCHSTRGAVSKIQQLTQDGRNLRPAWSPDGQKVAFQSNRTGNDDIWVASLDSGKEVQLTKDAASDRRPNWSPDGAWIAFDSDRSGNRDIWIIKSDGTGLKQLTTTPNEELFASWSPDGQKIAYFSYGSGTNELWVINVDGQNSRPVVPKLATEQARQCSFACHQPSWNQTGEKLAFQSEQTGNRNIWVVNLDGTGLVDLNTGPDEDYFPTWTPDGRIVFMTERIGADKVWNDVRVINADGSQGVTLFTEVAHGGPFYWSPDGNRIALHSQRGGAKFDIFVATLGKAPGEQPAPAVEQAATAAPTLAAAVAEKAPVAPQSAGAQWPAWLIPVAVLAAFVAFLVLGVIGFFIWRAVTR
ncbi:MAG: hypothetical protein A2Z04_09040 [Chloroflexi bacterium RBG_16_57_9]|nr:MAG: hypothetical protein A2Z04_09040 [Chloroflexi bacterium RBG_16_57_9]